MIEDMGEFGNTTPPPLPPGEQPVPPKSRSKARGVAAGVGVALVVAAGGGAIAASGSTSSASPGGAPPSEGAPPTGEGPATHGFGGGPGGGPAARGPAGLGGLGGLGRGVLHGTFVVAKPGGGYETEQVQTGTVGAVSATSLQVTSKDGFKATYVVPKGAVVGAQRDGIGSVKKGDAVVVTATVSGSTATVSRLLDTTDLKAGAGQWSGGPAGPGGPGHRGPKPGSGATPTAPPTTS